MDQVAKVLPLQCLRKHCGRSCLPSLFRSYGRAMAKCPLLFLLGTLILSLAVASTLLYVKLNIDTDPNLIWVPPGSNTSQQKVLFDAAFDPFFRVNQVYITLSPSGPAPGPTTDPRYGILNPEYMAPILALQQAIFAGVARDGTTLEDVCFRLEPGGPCLVQTPLNYFQSNPGVIGNLSAGDIQQFLACRFPADFCTLNPGQCTVSGSDASPNWIACLKDGVPMIPDVVFGGLGDVPGSVVSVCGDKAQSAQAMVLTFLLQSTPQKADAGAAWEKDVFLPLVAAFSSPGLSATYMAERSISDQLEVVDQQNQFVVLVSYAAMFIYIVFALGKFPHPLAMRSNLGFQGILIVALSVLCSLAIITAAGIHITMIVNEVVPFLILAIGVDNMFILTRAFDRRWWGPLGSRARLYSTPGRIVRPRAGSASAESSVTCGVDAETALCEALAEVGPSITAAAACEVVAFAVGVTLDIPALYQFCTVAAVAVSIDFVLQVLWFAPALLLDARRQEMRRVDCMPCLVLRGPGEPYTRCAPCSTAEDSRRRARESSTEEAVVDALGYGLTGMGMDVGLDRGYARFGPWQDAARKAMEVEMERVSTALAASGGGGDWYPTNGSLNAPLSGEEDNFRVGGGGSISDQDAYSPPSGSSSDVEGGGGGGSSPPPTPGKNSLASAKKFPRKRVLPRVASLVGVGSSQVSELGLGGVGQTSLQLPPFGASPRVRDDSPDPDKAALLEAYGYGGDEPGGPSDSPRNFDGPPPPSISRGVLSGGEGKASFRATDGSGSSAMAPTSTISPSSSSSASSSSSSKSSKAKPAPTEISPRFWATVNRGNFVRRFLSQIYVPFLLQPITRGVVLGIWVLLLSAGGYCVLGDKFKLGLEQQLVLPTGSYLSGFFNSLAHSGEAGPPVYIVLQNINYTHPQAFTNITNMGTALGSLNNVLVPPVYSWLSDFVLWNLFNPSIDTAAPCPAPLNMSAVPFATAVSFFLNLSVTGDCCQSRGYCGGQYVTDIQFLWGVPKASGLGAGSGGSSSGSGSSSYTVIRDGTVLSYEPSEGFVMEGTGPGLVTKVGWDTVVGENTEEAGAGMGGLWASRSTVSVVSTGSGSSSRSGSIGSSMYQGEVDDGGCDLGAGYVGHKEVMNALALEGKAMGVPPTHHDHVSPRVSLGSAVAAGFPASLVNAMEARQKVSSSGGLPPNLMPCHILISRLRGQHRPLRNQSDFINSKAVMQTAVNTLQVTLPTITDLALLGIPPGSPASTAPWPPTPGASGGATTDNTHTSWLPAAPGGAAFPYSLVYVYYEQYDYIRGVAVSNITIALTAVFLACLLVSSLSVALVTALLVASLVLSVCGWTWMLNPHGATLGDDAVDPFGDGPYGVDLNAVFVVNLITAAGLGVEFLIHIASAYLENIHTEAARLAAQQQGREGEQQSPPPPPSAGGVVGWWKAIKWLPRETREKHLQGALVEMGSSVVTGITFTKLVGVTILARAPSQLFRLYYFRECHFTAAVCGLLALGLQT